MNLLQGFKNYLFSQEVKPSKVTVKNYLSDINHFIRWFEKSFQKPFFPTEVTKHVIDNYKIESSESFSASSVERHLSSLRKFFSFLLLENLASVDPFKPLVEEAEKDPWHIRDFKSYLYVFNASHLTIKNYLIDIKQFLNWAEEVTGVNNVLGSKNTNVLNHINSDIIEEYKQRLISLGTFSPATINRKLSSLRKYVLWIQAEGLISPINLLTNNVEEKIKAEINAPSLFEQKEEQKTAFSQPSATTYSPFPPYRLFQKVTKGIILAVDTTLITQIVNLIEKAESIVWKTKGEPIFTQAKKIRIPNVFTHEDLLGVKNIKKELYAPLEISTKYFPWYKKAWFTLRYNRPKWYKTYHSYAIVHYFHFAVLVIFVAGLAFGFYNGFVQQGNKSPTLAANLPTNPPRILSFQGRLTDNNDNPITSGTNLRFAIYRDSTASDSALLWQEVNRVNPDTDGIFNAILGNTTTIPQSLFSENNALWLGVTVEATSELTPRQQLATVAFAANSETLQGLLPITATAAGTTNVVLALNSSGNLVIGGSATPTFQATGGQFTLSGQALVLTTNAGTNGNVQLSPDGLGKIDLNKPIVNTSLNNNIGTAVGSVEVDDSFSILASQSGQSALTINATGANAPLISASASGVSKFTVDNSGNISAGGGITLGTGTTIDTISAGTLGIGTANQNGLTIGRTTTANTTIQGANFVNGGVLYGLSGTVSQTSAGALNNCLIGQGSGSAPIFSTCPGGTNWWNQLGGALSPVDTTNDLLLGSTATSSALFSFTGIKTGQTIASISGQLIVMPNNGWGGSVGIGTTSPGATLDIAGIAGTTLNINNSGLGVGLNLTSNSGGQAALIINKTGNNDILTASSSGFTRFTVGQYGTVFTGSAISSTEQILGTSSASLIAAIKGYNGFTNFSGGIGTGATDNMPPVQRLTSTGNLVNIGSIRAGEMLLTRTATFAAKVNYSVGGSASTGSIATGDVNRDGKPDIVYTDGNTGNKFCVLLNKGDGTFNSASGCQSISTVIGLALGDLNGDGSPDIAAGSNSGLYLSMNNGDGTFSTPVKYTSTGGLGSIVIKDVNGDGKPDVVTSNGYLGGGQLNISVFINRGNGILNTRTDYTTGSGPRQLAIGDINGDGWPDIAVANINNGSASTVSVFINNGNGTFASQVTYNANNGPNGLGMADVNGDGKLDLIVSNYSSNNVSVLFNQGSGTFGNKADYATAPYPETISLGDINGDGWVDIVSAGITFNTVLINNGAGTFFGNRVDYVTSANYPWGNLADVNGDGKLDMISFNASPGTVSVFINQPAPILYAQASTGYVGIGFSSTPSAIFDVRGTDQLNAGTLAIASISGKTSFAALVANNDGLGDLFTASASGTNKFVIKNNGTIIAPQYATCTLKTDANGLFTCGTDNGGYSPFQELSGAIVPNNSTVDFLIGGQATTSAQFGVLNIAKNQAVATVSGNLIVMPNNGWGGHLTIGVPSSTAIFHVAGKTTNDIGRFDIGIDFNPVSTVPETFTLTNSAAAGSVDAGIHYYYITYYTDVGETEIDDGTRSSITAPGAKAVDITNIPTSSDYRVIGRKIYRSTAGSNYYDNVKLVTTITNNTQTTYQDAAADSSLTGTNYYYKDNTTTKYITVQNQSALFLSSRNTILGLGAGATVISGTAQSNMNTLMGNNAGASFTTGAKNTAIGYTALENNTSGDSNTAIGWTSLGSLTQGSSNVGVGRNAGQYNQTGTNNVYLGYFAGLGVLSNSNDENTFVGSVTGFGVTTGSQNTLLGQQAGYNLTSGNHNIVIGSDVNLPFPTGDQQLNIGNVLYGTGMYGLSTNSSSPAFGKIGLNIETPLATFDVRGANGTISIASVSGTTSFAALVANNDGVGDLFTASSSGTNKFTVQRNGLILAPTYNAAGCTLKADTNGLITCGTDNTGSGVSWWNQLAGALSPVNTTNDLLIGSTATSSALFSFTGIKTGQTIASASGNLIVMPNNGWGGNVGIGTTTPDAKLAIKGGTGTLFDIQHSNGNYLLDITESSGNGLLRMYNSAGSQGIQLSATSALNSYILNSNVGIGTTNPGAKLDVSGTIQTNSQVLVPAGVNLTSNPGYAFTGYPNYGFYLDTNSGYMQFVGNGVKIGGFYRATSTGFGFNNGSILAWNGPSDGTPDVSIGRVGVGVLGIGTAAGGNTNGTLIANTIGINTTTPTALLDVAGAASVGGQLTFRSGTAQIQSTANQLLTIGGTTTGDIKFMPGNSSSSLYVQSNGNVGVGGTNNPFGAKLYVISTAGISPLSLSGETTNGEFLTATTVPGNYALHLTTGGSNVATSELLGIQRADSTKVVEILYNGNVGIGTTAPDTRLVVGNITSQNTLKIFGSSTVNQAPVLSLFRNAARESVMAQTDLGFVFANTGGLANYNDSTIDSASNLIINNSGNVGIGTTAPVSKLHIHGDYNNTGAGGFMLDATDTADPEKYVLRINPFVIGAGMVGYQFQTKSITGGTTVPLTFDNAGNVGIGTTSPTALLDVAGAASVGGQLTFRSGTAQIQSTVNQGLTIGGNTTGNITLAPLNGAIGGNVVPLVNQQTDLGTSSLQWRNIYAQNFIGGTTGIQGLWQRTLGSLAPTNITDSLNLGAVATGSALVHLAGTAGENSWINTGNVGIGTTSPTALLHVNGGDTGGNAALIVNQTGNSANDIFTASSSGTTQFRLTNAGSVYAHSFYDLDNPSYFLDPAATGTSLAVLGGVGIGTASANTVLRVAGTTTNDIGTFDIGIDINPVLPPPTTTSIAVGGAGNVNAGQHYYYVTYYTNIGETQLSVTNPTSVTPGVNSIINITNIPTSSDYRVVGRKIYRTTTGSAYYNNVKLVTTIANNTDTSYSDNTADASLTGTNYYWKDNNTSKFITVNNNPGLLISDKNTILGLGAGSTIFSGSAQSSKNTLIGGYAGSYLTTGAMNTALGNSALIYATSGDSNIAIGYGSLQSLNTGSGNVGIGRNSGTYNQSGVYSTFVGYYAGFGVSTNSNSGNTFLGALSGYGITTGDDNTALGVYAGYNLTTGTDNIAIGQFVNLPNPAGNNQLNIGNVIYGTGIYGGDTQSSTPAFGKIGLNTQTPLATFDVRGASGTLAVASIFGTTSFATLVANNDGVGDLFTASASGATRFVIQNSGNVGIGKTTPEAALQVESGSPVQVLVGTGASTSGNIRFQLVSSDSSTASAQIWNAYPNRGAGNCASSLCHTALSLKLGQNNTTIPGLSDRFINFASGKGYIIGKIQGNGTSIALSATGGDYAEWFKKANVNEPLNPGDLACNNGNGEVVRCDSNNTSLLGVISDSYFLLGNSTDEKESDPNYVVVGLVGQIKTQVSSSNGVIKPGDLLTFSSIPGVAVKAIKSGFVIGKALENGTSGRINAYINPNWYDPDVYITSTGNLNITTNQGIYTVTNNGNLVDRIGVFASSIVGNLQAGSINAKNIVTDAITVAGENLNINGQSIRDYIAGIVEDIINSTNNNLISPIASVDQVNTNLISPISPSSVALKLEEDRISILNGNSSSSATVTSFDNKGNATFSGQLSASSGGFGNATISGTLRAGKIIANDIEGLNIQTSTISANYVTNNYYNSSTSAFPTLLATPSNVSSASSSLFGNMFASNSFINIATYSSELAYVENLNAANAAFSQSLTVFGSTTLSDTSVIGQLSVNGSLILANNSINVLGSDLNLQPLRQGGLSIMAGLFYIDTNGNVITEGNATIKGTLYANAISPIPGSDLAINLGTSSALTNSSLNINNASGSAILAINQKGDLIASGAATFGKLNLGGLIAPALAVSSTEVIATGSAGTGTISTNKTQMTINNELVTDKSLIYITPTSNTNQPLFLLRQVPGQSFTVGIQNPSLLPIKFNWIIVN